MKNDACFRSLQEELKKIQSSHPLLYGWTATMTRQYSWQRLLYSGIANTLQPETLRDNISDTGYRVTVYSRYGEPVAMGSLSIKLDPLQPFTAQIEAALQDSLAVRNQPWDLVMPAAAGEYPQLAMADPAIRENPAGTCAGLVRQASKTCAGLQGVNVNYSELFVGYRQELTVSSTGLEMPYESTFLYYEIAMEKLPLPNRQEIHKNKIALTLAGLQITGFITQAARETSWLGDVELPETEEQAVILVKEDVMNAFFHCLLDQLDAAREYMKQPCLKEGASIHSGERLPDAEPVYLQLDPAADYMAETMPFTNEGLQSLGGTVIENNVVKQRYVSNRMAQYLNYPCNPVAGNIILAEGSHSYEELCRMGNKVIEIITFSSLLLNPDYLTYSSEIKLAREYDNITGKVRYLKGGVVSGNIRENLRSCLFSNNRVVHNIKGQVFESDKGYSGPQYMLLRTGVAIAGK